MSPSKYGRLRGSPEPDDGLNFFPEMLSSTWRNIPAFHGQVLETTTEDLTRTQTSEGNSGVLVKDFRLFCREYHRAHAS